MGGCQPMSKQDIPDPDSEEVKIKKEEKEWLN